MELRGFDDYEVTLGDEMRGQRATLGKTLLDAESDLRIKAGVLRAIEDCDLDGFPNMSVVPGYVRSYARYLEMDPDDSYQRFCAESGYRSPTAELAQPRGGRSGGRNGAVATMGHGLAAGTDLLRSRFAWPAAPRHFGSRISLGSLVSAVALLALIGGLGYGGYALLQEVQRVGIAPLPEAPAVIAEAPLIAPPVIAEEDATAPGAGVYEGDGALAAVVPPEGPPPLLAGRDGPISAIDPATSGLFADRAREQDGEDGGVGTATLAAEDETPVPAPGDVAARPVPAAAAEPARAAAPAEPQRVEIVATDAAWVRVRDGEATVFQGTLPPGGSFAIPPRLKKPVLRAGNAGALYLRIGDVAYGPIGRSGQVVGEVSLRREDIVSALPQADRAALATPAGAETVERAAAD